MRPDEVIFVEDGHVYLTPEGVRLPSVTRIRDFFIKPYYSANGIGKELGKAVHDATALWDQDNLDWDSLDERIEPYVQAWMDFREVTGFKPLAIEKPLGIYQPTFFGSFAGTPDRYGIFGDKKIKPTIVEIKCSDSFHKGVEIQTALYAMLYKSIAALRDEPPYCYDDIERVAVYLRSDGSFVSVAFENECDSDISEGMIGVYNWLLSKNYIKEG